MTYKTVRIDFTSNSEYSFTHTINGTTFKVYVRYDILYDRYFLDVEKEADGLFVPLAYGVPLTSGVNVFAPYQSFGLGNLYLIPVVNDEEVYSRLPSAEDLTKNWLLIWQYVEV